jgi:hypothetical protein
MKAQFLLMFITLNGLLLCANTGSAAAATATTHQVTHLSETIANLIGVDDRNLVAQAINRALLAQNTREDRSSLPQIAGDVQQVPPKPIVNGRIANPKPEPTRGEGRPRRVPQNPPVGTPTNEPPVIINGLIRNDR